jgi:hypothetical protein
MLTASCLLLSLSTLLQDFGRAFDRFRDAVRRFACIGSAPIFDSLRCVSESSGANPSITDESVRV